MIIEGIKKGHRKYFTDNIKKISEKYYITFEKENAIVTYNNDYKIDKETIQKESRAKKELYHFLHDFRLFCFNAENELQKKEVIK